VECPHFPFTPVNYGRHGEIETGLVPKLHARAEQVLVGDSRKRYYAALQNAEKGSHQALGTHSELVQLFHLERDADGLSFCDRWLADPKAGLSNDERFLLSRMDRMRPALLEVQRLVDEQTMEVVDVFNGGTLSLIDRSLAARADRYSTWLTWCYSMPHYERTNGIISEVPEFGDKSSWEGVEELIRNLGGPSDPTGRQVWLAWNFTRICKAMSTSGAARPEMSPHLLEGKAGDSPAFEEDFSRNPYATFVDESLPALNGQTPRAAAASVQTRQLLVKVMKRHIRDCDRQRREQGLDLDLNPVLKELGLHELISNSRPLNRISSAKWHRDGANGASDLDNVLSFAFGPESEGDIPILSAQEIDARLKTMRRKWPTHDDALENVRRTFPGLLEETHEILHRLIQPGDWLFLELLLVRACHILTPKVGPAPDWDSEALIDGVQEELRSLSELMDSLSLEEATESWLQDATQPVVMEDLTGILYGFIERAAEHERPSAASALVILAFMGALITELSLSE
jgi:hypothetical protein